MIGCPGFSWGRVNFHKKLARLTQTATQITLYTLFISIVDCCFLLPLTFWLTVLIPTQEFFLFPSDSPPHAQRGGGTSERVTAWFFAAN